MAADTAREPLRQRGEASPLLNDFDARLRRELVRFPVLILKGCSAVSQEDRNNDVWTVRRALGWTCGYLERKGDGNPRVSSEWLLSEACGLSRIDLYMNPDRPLERGELDTLHDYVLRRGKGEPLQYITGEAPFRYLTVKVRPGVLIPRPETEVLVSEALACLPPAAKREAAWSAEASAQEAAAVAELKARIEEARAAEAAAQRLAAGTDGGEASGGASSAGASACVTAEASEAAASDAASDAFRDGSDVPVDPANAQEASGPEGDPFLLVADICTGSGCIACSIASERPDARVIAVDLAPEAVALARENAEALGLSDRVKVISGDLGSSIPERYLGRFDLIVSNPPYVPTAVLDDIPHEVSAFEPVLALDGGADGLDLFRRLAPWAHRALKAGGAFACELHETHLEEAAAIARGAGFAEARIVRDLADRPRVLVCRA